MGKRRKPLNGPPPGTGADFLTGEAGPPISEAPMPPVRTRGRLVAGNKLEITWTASSPPPGDVPTQPKEEPAPRQVAPLVPTATEIAEAKLPRWAEVALAGRCARRVWPLVVRGWFDDESLVARVRRGVELVERSAAEARIDAAVAEALREAQDAAHSSPPDANAHAASAVCEALGATEEALASRPRHPRALYPYQDALRQAVFALMSAATVGTPIRKQLLCIRRDFDRLARLAREQNWTDETPVPPEAFGPLWPEKVTPDWAKRPSPPAAGADAPPA